MTEAPLRQGPPVRRRVLRRRAPPDGCHGRRSELDDRADDLTSRRVEAVSKLDLRRFQARAQQAQREGEADQTLLSPVVEVSFEPAPLGVPSLDDSCATCGDPRAVPAPRPGGARFRERGRAADATSSMSPGRRAGPSDGGGVRRCRPRARVASPHDRPRGRGRQGAHGVDVSALADGVCDFERRVGQRLGDPLPQTSGWRRLAQLHDEPGEHERIRLARSRLKPTAAASAVSATAWPSQSRRSRSPLPTNARSKLVAKVAATRPRYAHPARTTSATTRCLVRLERTAPKPQPRSTGATRPGRSGRRVVRDRRNAPARLRRAGDCPGTASNRTSPGRRREPAGGRARVRRPPGRDRRQHVPRARPADRRIREDHPRREGGAARRIEDQPDGEHGRRADARNIPLAKKPGQPAATRSGPTALLGCLPQNTRPHVTSAQPAPSKATAPSGDDPGQTRTPARSRETASDRPPSKSATGHRASRTRCANRLTAFSGAVCRAAPCAARGLAPMLETTRPRERPDVQRAVRS